MQLAGGGCLNASTLQPREGRTSRMQGGLAMKHVIGCAFLLVLSQPILAAQAHVPKIGERLDRKHVADSANQNRCMTHSGQIDPCFEKRISGIEYTIAFDGQHRVTYISTKDSAFRTSDGYRVGDEIEVSRDLQVIPGYEIHARNTRDGWRPIVGFNSELQLKDGTKIDLRRQSLEHAEIKAIILGFSKGRL